MKIFGIILLFVFFVNFASCQNISNNDKVAVGNKINGKLSTDDFEKKLSETPNAQLIDVRTPEEFADGHLKNALNINFNSADFEEKIGKLDKNRPVMVYCLSGGRSSSAANKMANMGFVEIFNMQGGIMQWGNKGKPIEKGNSIAKPSGYSLDDFNKMVVDTKYILVDFNAKWCAPCKKMMPILEHMALKKKDKLRLIKIDADDNKELLNQKGIGSIPYLELYKDGKLVWKHDGFIEERDLLKETGL